MRSIALVAIQLEEAKRMIGLDTEPHLRMALILLDNTAEVLMYRMCNNHLPFNHLYGEYIKEAEGRDLTNEEAERLKSAKAKFLSPDKWRKVRRFFDEKAKYLAKVGEIDKATADVISRLHDYRCEAYHGDKLRIGSLRPCVMIYFDVACELMATYRPMAYEIVRPGDVNLERYFTSSAPSGQPPTARIAEVLRQEVQLNLASVRSALIDHLGDRIDRIEGLIKEISNGLTLEDAMRLVQIPYDADITSIDEVRTYRVTYSTKHFAHWREKASAIG